MINLKTRLVKKDPEYGYFGAIEKGDELDITEFAIREDIDVTEICESDFDKLRADAAKLSENECIVVEIIRS